MSCFVLSFSHPKGVCDRGANDMCRILWLFRVIFTRIGCVGV